MSTPEKDFVDETDDDYEGWEEMQEDDEDEEVMLQFKLDEDKDWRLGYCFAALENKHTRVVYNAKNNAKNDGEKFLKLLKKSAGVHGSRFTFEPSEQNRIVCTLKCENLNRVQMLYILTLFRIIEEFENVVCHLFMKEANAENLIETLARIGVDKSMEWNNHYIIGPRGGHELRHVKDSSLECAINLAAKAKSVFDTTSLVFKGE